MLILLEGAGYRMKHLNRNQHTRRYNQSSAIQLKLFVVCTYTRSVIHSNSCFFVFISISFHCTKCFFSSFWHSLDRNHTIDTDTRIRGNCIQLRELKKSMRRHCLIQLISPVRFSSIFSPPHHPVGFNFNCYVTNKLHSIHNARYMIVSHTICWCFLA